MTAADYKLARRQATRRSRPGRCRRYAASALLLLGLDHLDAAGADAVHLDHSSVRPGPCEMRRVPRQHIECTRHENLPLGLVGNLALTDAECSGQNGDVLDIRMR